MDPHLLQLLPVALLREIQKVIVQTIDRLTNDFLDEVRSVEDGDLGGQNYLKYLDLIRTDAQILMQVNGVIALKTGG